MPTSRLERRERHDDALDVQGAAAFDETSAHGTSAIVDMTSMFAGGASVGLSLDNDARCSGWAQLPVQPGVDFDAGTSYYNPTSLTARSDLRAWTTSGPSPMRERQQNRTPGTPTAVGLGKCHRFMVGT